jgi:hypothetical protein
MPYACKKQDILIVQPSIMSQIKHIFAYAAQSDT